MKSVGHWILFILKAIITLLLLPLWLLYAWIRSLIARCAFISAAKKAGMNISAAKLLASELAPHNILHGSESFTSFREFI